MADNEAVDVNISGGINGDMVEFDDDLATKKIEAKENSSEDHYLKARIEELEQQNRELAMEKDEMKAAFEKKMEAAEAERNELEMKAMHSITQRAFDLEGEVVRLQHDLGSALNAGDEANREVERLMREVDELNKEKSAMKEVEEKVKARLVELEREIIEVKKEKKAVEGRMASLDGELKISEEKVIRMSHRVQELAEAAQANGKTLEEMLEKQIECEEGRKTTVTLPAAAGAVSAGMIVAGLAVFYINFSRKR